MLKKRKKGTVKAATIADAPMDDAILFSRASVENAILEITYRIDFIARDFADDPGMMEYRRALILAAEALRKQLPGGS